MYAYNYILCFELTSLMALICLYSALLPESLKEETTTVNESTVLVFIFAF